MTTQELFGSALGVGMATAVTVLGFAWLVTPSTPVNLTTVIMVGLIYALVEAVRVVITRRRRRQTPESS